MHLKTLGLASGFIWPEILFVMVFFAKSSGFML